MKLKFINLKAHFYLYLFSLGNIAVCRAYISEATRESERTGAISRACMVQIMGFAVGPSLQSCVTPLGEHGFTIISGIVELNMFTATGWLNVAMSIGNFVLFLPLFFKVVFVDKYVHCTTYPLR